MTMSGTVDIRPAAPSERGSARALLRAAGLPLAGLNDVAVLLVAVRGCEVVGCAALERHGDGPGVAYLLRSVAVREDLRGSGAGGALTGRALAEVDAAGASVALLTETADAYFPRFGFRPVRRDELPSELSGSAELQGACAVSARALLRPAGVPAAR